MPQHTVNYSKPCSFANRTFLKCKCPGTSRLRIPDNLIKKISERENNNANFRKLDWGDPTIFCRAAEQRNVMAT